MFLLVQARTPVVCQAAAAEVVEAADSSPKEGVAHLRFKRGSAFKVGVVFVWLLLLPLPHARTWP